jgi:WD40 repeat protein
MGTCLALSPCASFLAVCTSDKNLTVWKLSSMDVLKQWKAARKVSSLTFNSDSSQLLVAGNNVYISQIIIFKGLDYCLPHIISRQSW